MQGVSQSMMNRARLVKASSDSKGRVPRTGFPLREMCHSHTSLHAVQSVQVFV